MRKWKRWLKYFDKRKNRRATKDAIKAEQFDRIPPGKKVKQEDSWNWD